MRWFDLPWSLASQEAFNAVLIISLKVSKYTAVDNRGRVHTHIQSAAAFHILFQGQILKLGSLRGILVFKNETDRVLCGLQHS